MLNWKKLLALSRQEWLYLATALVLLPLLRFSLKIWSLQSVLVVLVKTSPISSEKPSNHSGNGQDSAENAKTASLIHMVNLAAVRSPVYANCLSRSLAVWWLLRLRGLETELRLGVKPLENGIQAHAWVEQKGRVLNEEAGVARKFAAFEKVVATHERQKT